MERIVLSNDDKMVKIDIRKEKAYQTRVELDMLLTITSFGKTDEIAGKNAEDIAMDIAKQIVAKLDADEDVYVANYGVRAVDDPEEIEEDE